MLLLHAEVSEPVYRALSKTPTTDMLTSVVNPENYRAGPGSGRRVLTWHGSRAGARWAQET